MANHAGDAQAAPWQRALAQVVAAVEVGVGHDGAARHFVERDVLGGEVGRAGDHHRVAHATRVLQRPRQGLHAAQAAAHHSGQGLNAQRIEQPRLGVHPVFHCDDREVGAPGLAGGRVGVGGTGGAETRTQVVDTNDKEAVGVQRFAGADHVVPPAFAARYRLATGVGVQARHMVRGVERVADQHRVAALGVERAIGLKHQLVGRQLRAALQQQGFVETARLGRDDQRNLPRAMQGLYTRKNPAPQGARPGVSPLAAFVKRPQSGQIGAERQYRFKRDWLEQCVRQDWPPRAPASRSLDGIWAAVVNAHRAR